MHDRLAFGMLEIERNRPLVAVIGRKEAGGEARKPAGRVTVDRFDFHYIRAEIGEHHAGARPMMVWPKSSTPESFERLCEFGHAAFLPN